MATGQPSMRARPGDDGAAVELADLEERALVHDRLDDRAHLVHLARIARNRVAQPLLASLGVIVHGAARRQVVD
jgi:hypothetical protein